MQRLEADVVVSVADLQENPAAVMDNAEGATVAILSDNQVMAYMVPPERYEAMLEQLDDLYLVEIAKARAGEVGIPVDLDAL